IKPSTSGERSTIQRMTPLQPPARAKTKVDAPRAEQPTVRASLLAVPKEASSMWETRLLLSSADSPQTASNDDSRPLRWTAHKTQLVARREQRARLPPARCALPCPVRAARARWLDPS